MATITQHLFSPMAHGHLVPYLAALHGSCITHDQMGGSFLPPLNHEKLLAWWKDKIAEVSAGALVILLLLAEAEPGTKLKGSELMGAVMLRMHPAETSPHVALVESLLISPKFRRKGGGRSLMTGIELEALQRGRTLLRLETEVGTVAATFFTNCGYTEAGRIPGFSLSPVIGERRDEIIFYKDLGP